jgi:hypothetical protein
MPFPNTNTNKDIENYLSKIFTKLSEEEINHFNKLYSMFPQNNTFERILSIIIRVEENRLESQDTLHMYIQLDNKLTPNETVHPNQEIGEFAKGLIDLSPPDIQDLYIKFAKEERILNLNYKLYKTFKNFKK